MWNRRELLRAAGAGTAAALLGGLGCATPPRATASLRGGDLEAVRLGLRDAIEILATRLREPVAYAVVRRRVRALVDLAQREVTDATTIAVVVGGRDARGAWRERGIDGAAPELVRQAARALVADAPMTSPTPVTPGSPTDDAAPLEIDPDTLATGDWLAQAEVIAKRAEATATSRIVYRAAYVTCDDERSWVVTADADRSQRLVRTRIGATAVAWQGNAPIAGTAEVVGGFGPDHQRLTDAAIAQASSDALALHAASAITAHAAADVVLAPSVVAGILDVGWDRLAPGGLATITDDPTLAGGFGSYFFDDLGATPAPIVVSGPDALRGGGRARRSAPRWRISRGPSNLVMAIGAAAAVALEAQLDDGFVIDGIADLQHDHRGALAIRATRARRVAKGKRTGESWRDVELRGDAGAILGAIRAIGDRAEAFAPWGDDRPARAIVAPSVLTRIAIAPSRGDA